MAKGTLSLPASLSLTIYIYIYIYVCVCVCVCIYMGLNNIINSENCYAISIRLVTSVNDVANLRDFKSIEQIQRQLDLTIILKFISNGYN